MAYVTLSQMKSYLQMQSAVSKDDDLLTGFLGAAQIAVDHQCHRTFESPGDVTKYYQADSLIEKATGNRFVYSWDASLLNINQRVLDVKEDLLSVSTLVNGDGSPITPDQFWLMPRNTPPYQFIQLKSAAQWILGIDDEVAVTGQFCYSATADKAIQTATQIVAAYYYRNKDNQNVDVIVTPNGEVRIPQGFPAAALKILRDGAYVKYIGFA